MSSHRWLFGVLLLAGCPGGPSAPSTPSAFFDQYASSLCQFEARCGLIGTSETAKCQTSLTTSFRDSLSAYNYDDAVKANRIKYDSSAGQQCISSLDQTSCDFATAFNNSPCMRVIAPLVAVGGVCFSASECVSYDCSGKTTGCMGTCLATTGCIPGGPTCTADQYCDSAARVCKTRIAVGGACDNNSYQSCKDKLVCNSDPNGGATTCVALPTAGQTCLSGYPFCDTNLFCNFANNGRVCAARIAGGAACSQPDACADGLACIGLKPGTTVTPGTCKPYLDVGATCDATTQFETSGCPADLKCDVTCKSTALAEGADCSTLGQCDSNLYCNLLTKKCTAKLAHGATCDPATGSPCYSSCDSQTHTCGGVTCQ